MNGFLEWLFHSPHAYGIPESARYQYPKRSPEELSECYCSLFDSENVEKQYSIIGCLIRNPVVSLSVKIDIFNQQASKAKFENHDHEYTDLVADLFDAIYFNKEQKDKDEIIPEWVNDMTEKWKKKGNHRKGCKIFGYSGIRGNVQNETREMIFLYGDLHIL